MVLVAGEFFRDIFTEKSVLCSQAPLQESLGEEGQGSRSAQRLCTALMLVNAHHHSKQTVFLLHAGLVAPPLAFANAYGAGMTDWNMVSGQFTWLCAVPRRVVFLRQKFVPYV